MEKNTNFEFYAADKISFLLYETIDAAKKAIRLPFIESGDSAKYRSYMSMEPWIVASIALYDGGDKYAPPYGAKVPELPKKAQYMGERTRSLVGFTADSLICKMKEVKDEEFNSVNYWLVIAGTKFGWLVMIDEIISLERIVQDEPNG